MEHLDQALAQEFAGHGAAIHRLKQASPAFEALMEENYALWLRITNIQDGLAPGGSAELEQLEKERLAILDEIARRLANA